MPGGVCQPCSVAYSVANDARTACMCAAGYDPVTFPSNGLLLKCVARSTSCSGIPKATPNMVGNNCSCETGYVAQYSSSSSGRLQSCIAQQRVTVVSDSTVAESGTWVVIPVLANDAGTATRIAAVSQPLQGGRAVVVNGTAADTVKYISRDGFTGRDTFIYTTADGNASVTVDVGPGSCTGSSCGLLGSCSNGTCSCASNSGMLLTYGANFGVAARTNRPRVPTCRYPGERQKQQQL
jgi:hypothetical protein